MPIFGRIEVKFKQRPHAHFLAILYLTFLATVFRRHTVQACAEAPHRAKCRGLG